MPLPSSVPQIHDTEFFQIEYAELPWPEDNEAVKGGENGKFTAVLRPSSEVLVAFSQLQEAFTKAVLIHFDPTKPIRLETNSSGYAKARIMSQQAVTRRKQAGETPAAIEG
jgi:uncharacterized protein (DUF1330 family)